MKTYRVTNWAVWLSLSQNKHVPDSLVMSSDFCGSLLLLKSETPIVGIYMLFLFFFPSWLFHSLVVTKMMTNRLEKSFHDDHANREEAGSLWGNDRVDWRQNEKMLWQKEKEDDNHQEIQMLLVNAWQFIRRWRTVLCLLCSLSATAEFGKWVYVCVSTVVFFVDH